MPFTLNVLNQEKGKAHDVILETVWNEQRSVRFIEMMRQ